MGVDQAALDAVIAENFAGDWDIFNETAKCFLDALDENLKNLRDASTKNDVDAMVRVAHRLKGETSLFHIPAVHGFFKDMEAGARKGLMPTPEKVAEAEQATRNLAAEIRTAMETHVQRPESA